MEIDRFYWIVVLIAVVLLVLCLTGIGILMRYQNAGQAFPPTPNTCPDGWTTIGTKCTAPTTFLTNNPVTNNTLATVTTAQGFDGTSAIDFGNANWANICTKRTWANKFSLNWDGVTNYTKC